MMKIAKRPPSTLAARYAPFRRVTAGLTTVAALLTLNGCAPPGQDIYVINGRPEAVVTLGQPTSDGAYRVATSSHMFPSDRRLDGFRFWRLDMTNKYDCATGEHTTIKAVIIGKSGETRDLPFEARAWEKPLPGSVLAAIVGIVCDPKSGERRRVRSTPEKVFKTYLRRSAAN